MLLAIVKTTGKDKKKGVQKNFLPLKENTENY